MIRLSAGTAACLGLTGSRMDAYPKTAYLLSGKRCMMKCSFCPQGLGDNEALNRLGRISWPEYDWTEVENRLAEAESRGIQRICLQSVRYEDGIETLLAQINRLKAATKIPLSISAWIRDENEAAALFAAGVERMSISIDAINPEAFREIKGGSQQKRLDLLLKCAELFPAKMSTHLIVGLGETEYEALSLINKLNQASVTIALFAFVPIRGTKLENAEPPALDSYRRIQAGYYLMRNKAAVFSDFKFKNEDLISYGLKKSQLAIILSSGEAFTTSGCPGCNRPYYNERPGRTIYNYHRNLSLTEIEEAISLLSGGSYSPMED
ncbi:MAG: radical SAM protein [Firmicutes bacterium]|nr:radical SAM protein [Bacillota bacterium]